MFGRIQCIFVQWLRFPDLHLRLLGRCWNGWLSSSLEVPRIFYDPLYQSYIYQAIWYYYAILCHVTTYCNTATLHLLSAIFSTVALVLPVILTWQAVQSTGRQFDIMVKSGGSNLENWGCFPILPHATSGWPWPVTVLCLLFSGHQFSQSFLITTYRTGYLLWGEKGRRLAAALRLSHWFYHHSSVTIHPYTKN